MGASSILLVRYVGSIRQVVGYLPGRCAGPTRVDDLYFGVQTTPSGLGGFTFDAAGGRVLLPIATLCRDIGDNSCPIDYDGDGIPDVPYADNSNRQVVAISGFTTTFELLQSYTPQSSLGFRVPYMPEGMRGADHFDTYWGSLAHPIDFTQAHPLLCGYPVAPPHVGDYFTVADTVPTPAPGQGVYYVTATTYQGMTRYGGKASGGHLSGRDP
jgi:hypothetical protein